MRHLLLKTIPFLLALASTHVGAQFPDGVPGTSDYVHLLKATKYIENYQKMAAVSARVFNARGSGSDKEFSQIMGVVAAADLSDTQSCLIGVYRAQDLTKQDILSLVATFESPLGMKLNKVGQQKLIADIERGSVQPFPADVFTNEEKQQLVALNRTAAYQKYSRIGTDPAVAKRIFGCILESRDVKAVAASLERK